MRRERSDEVHQNRPATLSSVGPPRPPQPAPVLSARDLPRPPPYGAAALTAGSSGSFAPPGSDHRPPPNYGSGPAAAAAVGGRSSDVRTVGPPILPPRPAVAAPPIPSPIQRSSADVTPVLSARDLPLPPTAHIRPVAGKTAGPAASSAMGTRYVAPPGPPIPTSKTVASSSAALPLPPTSHASAAFTATPAPTAGKKDQERTASAFTVTLVKTDSARWGITFARDVLPLTVSQVKLDSIAYNEGLRTNDVVERINGTVPRTFEDAMAPFRSHSVVVECRARTALATTTSKTGGVAVADEPFAAAEPPSRVLRRTSDLVRPVQSAADLPVPPKPNGASTKPSGASETPLKAREAPATTATASKVSFSLPTPPTATQSHAQQQPKSATAATPALPAGRSLLLPQSQRAATAPNATVVPRGIPAYLEKILANAGRLQAPSMSALALSEALGGAAASETVRNSVSNTEAPAAGRDGAVVDVSARMLRPAERDALLTTLPADGCAAALARMTAASKRRSVVQVAGGLTAKAAALANVVVCESHFTATAFK